MTDCCRDCHFLTKYTAAYGPQPWDQEDRDLCRPKGNRDNVYLARIPEENRSAFKIYSVGCGKSEWERAYDEFANGSSRQSLKEEILKKRERTGKCDFGEYLEGMTSPDAEDLSRVRRDAIHQESTLFWQKFAAIFAFLAFLATLISICLQILEQGKAP